jgi:predicted ATPase
LTRGARIPPLRPGDAPDRQKTLRGTVDWSYRLLDEIEQRCFARFALFAGGASLEAAQAVTAARAETLHALIAKSLLARREQADGRGRLVMLQTIRDYALEQLAQDPEQSEIRRRHLDYYVRMVNQVEPKVSTQEDPAALRGLDVEIENIYVALAWALENAPGAALQLVGDLVSYWAARRDRAGPTCSRWHWLMPRTRPPEIELARSWASSLNNFSAGGGT